MPPDQPTLKTRLAHALFGDIIQRAVAQATASVTVRIDDSAGWPHWPGGPPGPPQRRMYRTSKTPSKPGAATFTSAAS